MAMLCCNVAALTVALLYYTWRAYHQARLRGTASCASGWPTCCGSWPNAWMRNTLVSVGGPG